MLKEMLSVMLCYIRNHQQIKEIKNSFKYLLKKLETLIRKHKNTEWDKRKYRDTERHRME